MLNFLKLLYLPIEGIAFLIPFRLFILPYDLDKFLIPAIILGLFFYISFRLRLYRTIMYGILGALVGDILGFIFIISTGVFGVFIGGLIVGPALVLLGLISGFLIGLHIDQKTRAVTTPSLTGTPAAAETSTPALKKDVGMPVIKTLKVLLSVAFVIALSAVLFFVFVYLYGEHRQSQRDDRAIYYVKQYMTSLDNACNQYDYFKDYRELEPDYLSDPLNQGRAFGIYASCVSPHGGIGEIKCSDVNIEYDLISPNKSALGTYEVRGQGDLFESHWYEYHVVHRCDKVPTFTAEESRPKIEIINPKAGDQILPRKDVTDSDHWVLDVRWKYQWIDKQVRVSLCPTKTIPGPVAYSPTKCFDSGIYPNAGTYPNSDIFGTGLQPTHSYSGQIILEGNPFCPPK